MKVATFAGIYLEEASDVARRFRFGLWEVQEHFRSLSREGGTTLPWPHITTGLGERSRPAPDRGSRRSSREHFADSAEITAWQKPARRRDDPHPPLETPPLPLPPPGRRARKTRVAKADWTRLESYLPGRRSRLRALVPLSLAGLSISVLAVSAVAAYPYLAAPGIAARYERIHQQTRAIEISAGGLKGVVPLAESPGRDGATHFYLPARNINPDWVRMVRAIEDKRLGKLGSVSCLDLPAIGKAFMLHLVGSEDQRGASSLCQLTSRAMRNLSPTLDRGVAKRGQRYRRKLSEFRDGMALYHALGGIDDPRFQALLGSHFELIRGAKRSGMGPTVRGVETSAQILWGKSQDRLSLAQAAILAAAVRWPIILAPEHDPAGSAEASEQWERVRKRAILAVTEAYEASDPRAQAAIAELKVMAVPHPYLQPELAALIDGPQARFGLSANLSRRAKRIAGPEMMMAISELKDRIGAARLAEIDGIALTLDAASNFEWGNEVAAALAAAAAEMRPRLLADIGRREGQDRDPLVAVLRVEAGGEVARHYSNRRDFAFVNGASAERGPDGRYRLEEALTPIGSLGKGVAALLLARRARITDEWCNRRIDGKITNPDGDPGVTDCSVQSATRSASDSFRLSLNLPIIEALRSVPDEEIVAAAKAMRLNLPPGVSPRIALTLGMATARLSDLVMLYGAIVQGTASQPSIVASYRFRNSPQWVTAGAYEGSTLDLRSYLNTSSKRAFVYSALAAPLMPGGTLASIRPSLPSGDSFVAKSGTVAVNGTTYRKYAVIASLGGHGTMLLYLGSANSRAPLGRNIAWSPLRPVVSLAGR